VAEVASTIGRVARHVQGRGGLVVVVAHRAPGAGRARGPRPPLPPLEGSAEAEALDLDVGADLAVTCSGTSGFHGSHLDAELRHRGVELLVMTGFGYEAAVESTLRGANDRGYECLTLADAIAPFDEHTGRHGLASITLSGGIFGAVGTSDELVSALGGVSVGAPS
jgi:nicotinamidase-related amidase